MIQQLVLHYIDQTVLDNHFGKAHPFHNIKKKLHVVDQLSSMDSSNFSNGLNDPILSKLLRSKRKHPFVVTEPTSGSFKRKKRRIQDCLASKIQKTEHPQFSLMDVLPFDESPMELADTPSIGIRTTTNNDNTITVPPSSNSLAINAVVEIVKVLHKKMQEEEREMTLHRLTEQTREIHEQIQKCIEEVFSSLKYISSF